MNECNLELPISLREEVASVIENVCLTNGLRQTMRGTLAAFPGCVHWHYKLDAQPGVLELTWWPHERRVWVKVAANRRGGWISGVVVRLQEALSAA